MSKACTVRELQSLSVTLARSRFRTPAILNVAQLCPHIQELTKCQKQNARNPQRQLVLQLTSSEFFSGQSLSSCARKFRICCGDLEHFKVERMTVFAFTRCSDSSTASTPTIQSENNEQSANSNRQLIPSQLYLLHCFIISESILLLGYGCYQIELDGATKVLSLFFCDFRQTAESQPRCEETTLYCQECDKMFSNACNLKRHLQYAAVHLKEDAQPVKCPNYFKPFPCYRAMREHWIRCTRKLRSAQFFSKRDRMLWLYAILISSNAGV